MVTNELENLTNFFGGYFHQDWNEDAETPGDVIEQFVHVCGPIEALVLSEAIQEYVNNHLDDDALEKALDKELGCYYLPSAEGKTTREWMLFVARLLDEHSLQGVANK